MRRSSHEALTLWEENGDDKEEHSRFRKTGEFGTNVLLEQLERYWKPVEFGREEDEVQKLKSELKKELEDLKSLMREWESISAGLKPKIVKTLGDQVYEKLEKQLESKYLGKIVAIDLDTEQVVAYGDSVEEAYEAARKKSDKDQFYFRLVGKSYLERF